MDAEKDGIYSAGMHKDADAIGQGGPAFQVNCSLLEDTGSSSSRPASFSPITAETNVVTIPWRLVLKRIIEALDLPVLQFGSRPSQNSSSGVRAHIEIGLPLAKGATAYDTVKLSGDTCASYEEAMENVAEKVVRFLQKNGVVILDASWRALKCLEKRIIEAEEKRNLCQVILDGSYKCEMERAAKLEKMFLKLKNVLVEFGDILSVTESKIDPETGKVSPSGVISTAKEPANRLEEISRRLVALLDAWKLAGANS